MVFIAHAAVWEPQSRGRVSKPGLQARNSNKEQLSLLMFLHGSSRGVEREESA